MTSRKEFSAKTKDQAHARANGHCENRACSAKLCPGKFHYDHILPCALGGTPVLANCQVLCDNCHKAKSAKEDVPRIRKADRQRRQHIGAVAAPVRPLKGRGFPPTAKPEKPLSKLANGEPEIVRRMRGTR